VRYVRGNAPVYNFDTSFIGITGSSSGGHLASLTGTSGSVKEFTLRSATADLEGDIGQFGAYSSSVDAVVDWFGPTDFLTMDSCGSQQAHNPADSPESNLIGGPIQENTDKCALANPMTYVDADDPPFLIFHGDKDPLVPFCQSEMFFKVLQNAKVPVQYFLVPGAQHGPGLFVEKYFKIMSSFFEIQVEVKKIKK